MEAKTYSIDDGPSAFDLAIAVFRNERRDYVSFKLDGKHRYESHITDARSIDKSHLSRWQIRGYINLGLGGHKFTARYNVSTRKGTLIVLESK